MFERFKTNWARMTKVQKFAIVGAIVSASLISGLVRGFTEESKSHDALPPQGRQREAMINGCLKTAPSDAPQDLKVGYCNCMADRTTVGQAKRVMLQNAEARAQLETIAKACIAKVQSG